jgi:outer membrane cobalamin receptor
MFHNSWILLVRIIIGFIIILPSFLPVYGGSLDSLSKRIPDSTFVSSPLQQSDSLSEQAPDTTIIHTPLQLLGSIDRSFDSTTVLESRQILWQDYITTPSILSTIPQSFLRDLGSPGQPGELTLNGLGSQDVAILIDGRPLNDPIFGVVNLHGISTEYIERIEYRTGPDAAAYALNGAGGLINIVTKSYNRPEPYSKIRYLQGAYDHIISDGILSQNVARNWNVMLGFQHQGTLGRFPNSDDDTWNTRGKIRWAATDNLTIELSHLYMKSQFGLNGGINTIKTLPALNYDERQATMMNTDAYEKQTRHDAALTIGARLFSDTTDLTVLNAYYSTLLREYRDEENRTAPNGIFLQADHRTKRYGISVTQDLHVGNQFFALKASVQRMKIGPSYFAQPAEHTFAFLSGRTTLTFADWIRLGLFGAYQQNLTVPQPSYGALEYGATGTFDLSENISLFAGAGMGTRLPTLGEWYWSDSLMTGNPSLPPVQHRTVEIGLNLKWDQTRLHASFQKRFLHHYPVLVAGTGSQRFQLTSTDEESITTASLSFSTTLWKFLFELDGMVVPSTGTSASLSGSIPSYTGRAGIFFYGNLVGSLDLKMGIRANMSGTTALRTLNPYSLTSIPSEVPVTTYSPKTLDAIIIGKIGSAIITLAWENITNENYVIVPFYPMQALNFRLGVAWEFMD